MEGKTIRYYDNWRQKNMPVDGPSYLVGRTDEIVYTHFTWAGGTFFHFQLCCCVRFLFWREIGFGFTYYYVLRVPYSCGVVLFFMFWWEIVFGVTYILRL